MKTIKAILVVGLIILLSGCSTASDNPQSFVVEGETLVECISKLSGEPPILYYLKDATQYKHPNLPVIVTYITDVNGNKLSLNNFEMENYVCQEIKKAA